MHYLQQAHCLLLKSLGAQTPKPNKLYATILIIPQINMYCNSQFTKYKVIHFMEPKVNTCYQSYNKVTIVHKTFIFILQILTTVLQFKSYILLVLPWSLVLLVLYCNLVNRVSPAFLLVPKL